MSIDIIIKTVAGVFLAIPIVCLLVHDYKYDKAKEERDADFKAKLSAINNKLGTTKDEVK